MSWDKVRLWIVCVITIVILISIPTTIMLMVDNINYQRDVNKMCMDKYTRLSQINKCKVIMLK